MILRKITSLTLVLSVLSFSANAATIHLKNGQQFSGDIKEKADGFLVVDMNGIKTTIPLDKIDRIDAGNTASPLITEPDQNVSQKTDSESNVAVVPEGTVLMIRMSDSINTRHHKAGQRFTGTLETNLMSGSQLVAKSGTNVYGSLSQLDSAGRVAGSASMTLELHSIAIDGTPLNIATYPLVAEGDNTGKSSAGRTGRTTAVGAIAGGSDGAKTGAKVGLASSILTKGDDIEIKQGTLLDFTLKTPLHVEL